MHETDSVNIRKVGAILDEFCWPEIELIGRKGNNAIFLVIQHADLDFQKKYMPLVEQAYNENKIDGRHMTLLLDRMSVRENGYQIYGTQLRSLGSSPIYQLRPLLYPDKVDSLRAVMGLDSLHTYVSKYNMEKDWREKDLRKKDSEPLQPQTTKINRRL